MSSALTVLRVTFPGGNPNARVVGLAELPGKSNYFIGKDPRRWRTSVPNYAGVKYEEVYPGIDLVYYGRQLERSGDFDGPGGQLEFDFIIAPGADPSLIRLAIETGNSEFEKRKSNNDNRQSSSNPESRTPNPSPCTWT